MIKRILNKEILTNAYYTPIHHQFTHTIEKQYTVDKIKTADGIIQHYLVKTYCIRQCQKCSRTKTEVGLEENIQYDEGSAYLKEWEEMLQNRGYIKVQSVKAV